jgi:hypothetical protein
VADDRRICRSPAPSPLSPLGMRTCGHVAATTNTPNLSATPPGMLSDTVIVCGPASAVAGTLNQVMKVMHRSGVSTRVTSAPSQRTV